MEDGRGRWGTFRDGGGRQNVVRLRPSLLLVRQIQKKTGRDDNAVRPCPGPGWTDCPVANTEYSKAPLMFPNLCNQQHVGSTTTFLSLPIAFSLSPFASSLPVRLDSSSVNTTVRIILFSLSPDNEWVSGFFFYF